MHKPFPPAFLSSPCFHFFVFGVLGPRSFPSLVSVCWMFMVEVLRAASLLLSLTTLTYTSAYHLLYFIFILLFICIKIIQYIVTLYKRLNQTESPPSNYYIGGSTCMTSMYRVVHCIKYSKFFIWDKKAIFHNKWRHHQKKVIAQKSVHWYQCFQGWEWQRKKSAILVCLGINKHEMYRKLCKKNQLQIADQLSFLISVFYCLKDVWC